MIKKGEHQFDFKNPEVLVGQIDAVVFEVLRHLLHYEITKDIDKNFIHCLKLHLLSVTSARLCLEKMPFMKNEALEQLPPLLAVMLDHACLLIQLSNDSPKITIEMKRCSLISDHGV